MHKKEDIARFRDNLKEERNASALYRAMAANEKTPELAKLYIRLAETEERHAAFWEKKLIEAGIAVPPPAVSFKTRVFSLAARRFGAASILPAIANVEKEAATSYDGQPDAGKEMVADEQSHARIFTALSESGAHGRSVAEMEGKHRGSGGNALRAGVLGANDGLVSVFNLVMGVAGAGVGNRQILLTGVAGLLAGALSMALGEWLSVQSSRELAQHQLDIEKSELELAPEGEEEELALIYQAKGIDAESARSMASKIINSKTGALDTLAREELGIDPHDLGGSAWEAAYTSFFLFSIGAIIPVLPFAFVSGTTGIAWSAGTSAVGLFAIGAAITLMTGKHPIKNGFRQVLFGLATAAVTFGIGRLVGVSLG